jgi:hypothetical protein
MKNWGKNKKEKRGSSEMAKIGRRFSKQGELFPRSLIAISDKLYNLIAEKLEEKIGEEVKKITQGKIKKIINDPDFRKEFIEKSGFKKEVKFVFRGSKLSLQFVVLDVSFTESHEGVIIVSLQLPLKGDNGQLKEAIRKIAQNVGLPEEVASLQYGIKTSVVLSGENLPHQISYPFPFGGQGRMAFVTKEEYQTGKYSHVG